MRRCGNQPATDYFAEHAVTNLVIKMNLSL